jgi:raffinose/stachyose/melibiose transport system substrate-binding protein
MGFTTPFKTFTGEYATDNPIVKAADEYQAEGKKNVQWAFLYDPSDEWKTNLGNSLLEYAQGTSDWDGVKKAFVDNWATEYETTKANQG